MTVLDDLLNVGDRRREQTSQAGRVIAGYVRVGLWSAGWAIAKLVTVPFGLVAAVLFGLGWACARSLPVLRWARTAFLLGWEAGRAPGGGRGPA